MKRTFATVMLAAGLALVRAGWAAEAVAMLTDLRGTVVLNVGAEARAATLLAYLEAGTRLRVEAGARAVVTLFATPQEIALEPGEYSVDAQGVRTGAGSPVPARALAPAGAAAARRFEPLARERLSLATVHMRGVEPRILLTAPLDGRLLDARPTLAWSAPRDLALRVTLRDPDGRIVFTQVTRADRLTVPEDLHLRPGVRYAWTVEPAGGSVPPAVRGHFSLAEAAVVAELRAVRPAAGAAFSERVRYAMRLDAEGFAEAARDAWGALSAERPDDETLRLHAERAQ